MKLKAMWTAVAVLVLTALAAGQLQEQYLDVYTVQVKPDHRAEFDNLSKKFVSANRQNKGDAWLTMETAYGPADRVTFISMRQGLGDAETASGTFYTAMTKAYGKPGTDKVFQEYSQCVVSARTEFRRRRWDLGSNLPTDSTAMMKMLGESRWLRTTVVHVRPGQIAAFETLAKDIKAAREKSPSYPTVLASQAVAGQEGTVFYFTILAKSLADFDAIPPFQQTLGDEGYARYLKTVAETISDSETVISRFLPELSNAPEQVVAVAPDYWRPKPVMAAKGAKTSMTPAANKEKVEDQH